MQLVTSRPAIAAAARASVVESALASKQSAESPSAPPAEGTAAQPPPAATPPPRLRLSSEEIARIAKNRQEAMVCKSGLKGTFEI